MKISSIFGIFALVLFVSACSTDKDVLSGTWEAVSSRDFNCLDPEDNQNISFTDGCFTGMEDGETISVCVTGRFTDETYIITTTFDLFGTTFSETDSGTYSITGDIVTLTSDDGSMFLSGLVNSNRNEMTLTGTDDEECDTEVVMRKR
jgi:hypothetical protein